MTCIVCGKKSESEFCGDACATERLVDILCSFSSDELKELLTNFMTSEDAELARLSSALVEQVAKEESEHS